MVLVLNGLLQSTCPENTEAFYASHPAYRITAKALTAMPIRVVEPDGLLYVLQREFAATIPNDKNVSVIGSEDATTCIIIIVRHSGSGAVALGHFDGSDTHNAVNAMINKLLSMTPCPEGTIEMQLIGGYADEKYMSEDLFFEIMNACHRYPTEISITLACVGQMNTEIRAGVPWPILYGVAVNVKTGEVFPATFPEKGPEECLRGVRHLSGQSEFLDLYDPVTGFLTVHPFDYTPFEETDLWLQQEDRVLLHTWSTSPLVEPPDWVDHIKAILKYMRDRPADVVFRNRRPLCFRRDERNESWELWLRNQITPNDE